MENRKENFEKARTFLIELVRKFIEFKENKNNEVKKVKDIDGKEIDFKDIDYIYLIINTGLSGDDFLKVLRTISGKERKVLNNILWPNSRDSISPINISFIRKIHISDITQATHKYINEKGELVEIPKNDLIKIYNFLLRKNIGVTPYSFTAMIKRYREKRLPHDFGTKENIENNIEITKIR